MTKYAEVFKEIRINEETELFFTAIETFNGDETDYEIVDVELVSITLMGTEIQASDLPKEVVASFLAYADDDNTEWWYY